ncbi:hypothetical protein D3C81_2092620 [compost metagenome]
MATASRHSAALPLPLAAATENQAYACLTSFGTPWPLAYIIPRLVCAPAYPCSAALRYQAAACLKSFGTPSPR